MELEVRHLRLVVAIAERGSISAAATALGIPQPAASSQLARIERALGGALFARDRHGVETTELGDEVVASAKPVILGIDRLMKKQEDLRARSTEELRIGGNETAAYTRFLPDAATAFTRPIISITDTSTTNLMEHLLHGEVDLIAVGVHPGFDGQLHDPALEQSAFVLEEPFLVALAREHPLATADELSLADLKSEAWLLPPGRPDGMLSAFHHAFAHAGYEPRTPHGKADLTHYAKLIGAQHAVGMATPTYHPDPGICMVPLHDEILRGRRVIRWRRDRIEESVARRMRVLLAVAYVDQVIESNQHQPWWHRSPQYRPTLPLDLLAQVEPAFSE